jgi:hypothetical protein
MLIFDGRASRVMIKAIKFCLEHKIVLPCLPPLATHILQSLDVGILAPLAALYKKGVRERSHFLIDYSIDKVDFLEIYKVARAGAITESNISKARKAVGQGSEKEDSRRCTEEKRYSLDVNVIFNPKAYANTQNLKGWVKNQFKYGAPFSLFDMEPRLLVLNAFEPYKKSRKQEEKEANNLVDEFKKLNTTISVIPGGCTGYIQPLDVSINNIIDNIVKQCEEDYYDANLDEYADSKC